MATADLGDSQLHYREFGEGDPVLGIMGYSLDSRYWAGQVPAVTKSHKFITFDNRSIGRSTGSPPTTIDEMANDAVRLLDHLGIEKTVVFGVSMGGTIAQRLTLDHPDRVSALILGVTWARPIEFMRRQHAVARSFLEKEGSSQELLEITMMRMFTPRFFEMGREAIDQIIASFTAAPGSPEVPSPDSLRGQLDAMDKHDTLADLPSISCPTLVLGGKMDMLVPYFAAEEIAGAIPGAKFVTFETGHACMIEELDAFNGAISDFLGSL
ncbi:MAG: alpha/beta fold hydrolase [Actinomycetota bacterium]